MMMKAKKLLAVLLAGAMALTGAACGSNDEEEYSLKDDDNGAVYNIALMRSADNYYTSLLQQGFADALYDLMGDNHVNISFVEYEIEQPEETEDAQADSGEAEDGEVFILPKNIPEDELEETDEDSEGEPEDGIGVETDAETDVTDIESDETEEEVSPENFHSDLNGGADEDSDDSGEVEQNVWEIPIIHSDDLSGYDMVYTCGIEALQVAAYQTSTVPIVSTGVVDFQKVLNIQLEEGAVWDSKTHVNVAGVCALPPIDQQLSLLIEATPELESVAIVYKEGDVDAIYQNEVMEEYLDQAGIPWKEYMIPLPEETDEDSEDVTIQEADAAAGEGEDQEEVRPLTDEELQEIENIENERDVNDLIFGDSEAQDADHTQPRESALWPEYVAKLQRIEAEDMAEKEAEAAAEEAAREAGEEIPEKEVELDEDGNPIEEPEIKHPITEIAEDATLEDILEAACSINDAIYLCSGSELIADAQTIGEIATENGVTTVSGDTAAGMYTLVSLYSDPYNMGYQAGKIAYRILVDGEEAGEIKLASMSSSAVQKLYNAEIAEQFGMTFPKSFMEINEFMDTYQAGSMTNRK